MSAARLRVTRHAVMAAIGFAALVGVTACGSPPTEGQQRALDYTERIAIGMADDATRGRVVVGIPAEALAAGMVSTYRTPTAPGVRPDSFSVDVLEWGGQSSWEQPAYIVMRITADVDEGVDETGGGWFSRRTTLPAGQATACYVITLPVSGGELGADVEAQSCLNFAPEAEPRPISAFELPEDAFELISGFLTSDRPLSEATELFEPPITVDARMIDDMKVIAARGVQPSNCIIVARVATGDIERVTLSPEQVMPGEIGCSADAARLLR